MSRGEKMTGPNRRSTALSRTRVVVGLLALIVATAALPLAARPAQAATTFTTTGDDPDAALTDPACDVDLATGGN